MTEKIFDRHLRLYSRIGEKGTEVLKHVSGELLGPMGAVVYRLYEMDGQFFLTVMSNGGGHVEVPEGYSEREKKAAAQAWQPIETAPKDGTWCLLYETFGDHKVTGSYDDELHCWCDNTDLTSNINPTHWMPLPPAPAQEGESDDKNS